MPKSITLFTIDVAGEPCTLTDRGWQSDDPEITYFLQNACPLVYDALPLGVTTLETLEKLKDDFKLENLKWYNTQTPSVPDGAVF